MSRRAYDSDGTLLYLQSRLNMEKRLVCGGGGHGGIMVDDVTMAMEMEMEMLFQYGVGMAMEMAMEMGMG